MSAKKRQSLQTRGEWGGARVTLPIVAVPTPTRADRTPHRPCPGRRRRPRSNGPGFPGLTRRVMGPVRLRLAARGAPQGEGARVTDKTDKMVMGRWPTQIERELAGVIF